MKIISHDKFHFIYFTETNLGLYTVGNAKKKEDCK